METDFRLKTRSYKGTHTAAYSQSGYNKIIYNHNAYVECTTIEKTQKRFFPVGWGGILYQSNILSC